MATYYLISTQILKDGSTAQSIFPYTNEDDSKALANALSAFHSTMASNYISETIEVCSCYVTNIIGGVIETAYIDNRKPEPEPEPEE